MLAFFSIIPTIPLSVYCCLILGVEGMNLPNLLLVYAALLTTTILSGSLGLLQPLEIDPSGKAKPANNFRRCPEHLQLVLLLRAGIACQRVLDSWNALVGGTLGPPHAYPNLRGHLPRKPLGIWDVFLRPPDSVHPPHARFANGSGRPHRLCHDAPPGESIANDRWTFTRLSAPFRMRHLVVACVFYDNSPPLGKGLFTRSAAFWFAHLLFGLFLMTLITPSRETLWSWSWRFRGRTSWVRDRVLGERSVNSLVLVIMACIGLADYFAMLVLPATRLFTPYEISEFLPDAFRMALACTILFLGAGSLFQWIIIAFDKSGRGLFFTLSVLLIVPADLAGRYFQIDFLRALTPSDHFGHWFNEEPSQNLLAMVTVYAAILLVTQVRTHRRIAAMNRVVDNKLRTMQAVASE